MYKCEISKAIWKDVEKTELHEVLVKTVQLPFPPYPGLSVSSGRYGSGDIVSVCWDTEKELFSASTNEEFPWEDEDLHLHTAEEIQNHLVKRGGWEILD